jgi:hypothetical protein
LSSHLFLDILSSFFPSGYPIKTFNAFLLSNQCYMLRSSHPWSDHSNDIRLGIQITKLLIIQFPPATCYPLPRKYKYEYSPQNPVFNHPQSVFFPQCKTPSCTPIQNYTQNYGLLRFNLYVFRWEHKRFWIQW